MGDIDFDPELDPYAAEAMETDGEFGMGECPRCGFDHWPIYGPIITENGNEFEDPIDSPLGTKWYCPDCWRERKAIESRRVNDTLDEFL